MQFFLKRRGTGQLIYRVKSQFPELCIRFGWIHSPNPKLCTSKVLANNCIVIVVIRNREINWRFREQFFINTYFLASQVRELFRTLRP